MVHKSIRALELDRRLLRRRGWINEAELAKRLEALPDVSDKIDRSQADGDADSGEGEGGATDPQTP